MTRVADLVRLALAVAIILVELRLLLLVGSRPELAGTVATITPIAIAAAGFLFGTPLIDAAARRRRRSRSSDSEEDSADDDR